VVLDNGPAAIAAGMVAVVCAAVALGAWRAVVRTGNRNIGFVVAAFALLGAKNLLKAFDLVRAVESGPLEELGFSLTDLVALSLIAWPLLGMRREA
jgi:hypothetical protein